MGPGSAMNTGAASQVLFTRADLWSSCHSHAPHQNELELEILGLPSDPPKQCQAPVGHSRAR